MYIFARYAKHQLAWVFFFALGASPMWLSGCAQSDSASEYSVSNSQRAPAPGDPWTADRLLEAAKLASIVSDPGNRKPLILNFGPAVLHKREHVPGADLIGPLSEPGGSENLKKVLKNLGRDTEIVIYCGCCPWNVCPNIRPAFSLMQDLGFKNVKVLYLPTNFRQDWVSKGLPVQKGE